MDLRVLCTLRYGLMSFWVIVIDNIKPSDAFSKGTLIFKTKIDVKNAAKSTLFVNKIHT